MLPLRYINKTIVHYVNHEENRKKHKNLKFFYNFVKNTCTNRAYFGIFIHGNCFITSVGISFLILTEMVKLVITNIGRKEMRKHDIKE